jgi:hypothetical protein
LWTPLSPAAIAQIAVGAAVGATVALIVHYRWPTRFASAAFTVVICTAAGVVTMAMLRWPDVPLLAAVGFVASAAPITLALLTPPRVSSGPEAIDYLKRAATALTIHMVLGIAFAVLGFLLALLATATSI